MEFVSSDRFGNSWPAGEIAGQKTARRAARAHQGFTTLGRRAVSQPAPDHSGLARSERVDANAPRISLRRRAARAAGAAAIDEPARNLGQAAREPVTRHVARSFYGADRNRRPARAHRSGVGNTRVAIEARRPQALPARACSPWRDTAARPRDRVARPLRPPRLPDHPQTLKTRRAIRDVARSRRAPRSLGRAARAHHRARLVGIAPVAEHRPHGDRRALAALLRASPERAQYNPVVLARHPFATACSVLQRRYGPHDGISGDPRTAWAVRPRDAGGGRVPSCLG